MISTEFHSWDCNRSIDILCIDTNGDLVVVELKRSKDAHMELQALRYAAMVSNMTFDNIVNEYRTTDEAKKRYWQENPPKGIRRLIPRGMLVPPVPVDDFAAVIIGEKYLVNG